MRFAGQVVLVTGAARGIGRACVELFLAEGATVVGTYRSTADEAAKLAEASGGKLEMVACDVRDRAAPKKLVEDVVKRHGRLDVLVNNAGVTRDTLTPVMSDEDWDEVMDTNAGGAFRMSRAVARPMMLARRGRIVNISSAAGQKAGRGQANYAASKAAIEGMTRALAVELAPKGILVNAVAPGIIVTDMSQRVREQGHDEALSKVLLKRFGEAREVAEVVVFLASEAAAYVTGVVVPVDGGFKMA